MTPRLILRYDPSTRWLDEVIARDVACVHSEEVSHRSDGAEMRVAYFRAGGVGDWRRGR